MTEKLQLPNPLTYGRDFQEELVALVHRGVDSKKIGEVVTATFVLYAPEQMIAGGQAGILSGFSPREAVAGFVFAAALVSLEARPSSLLERIGSKIRRRQTQNEHRLLIAHVVEDTLKKLGEDRLDRFTESYLKTLRELM